MSYTGYPEGTQLWIGANDLAHSGHLVWSDGERVSGYNNLAADEPGSSAGLGGRCLAVGLADLKWRREQCSDRRGAQRAFVAERSEALMSLSRLQWSV